MDEEVIELVCKLRWPARAQTGTFQKTIGRTAEAPMMHEMPSFPVALLHDADAFKGFCELHLDALKTRVQEPWEFWFEVVCHNAFVRQALPGVLLPVYFGPFPADRLANASDELRSAADLLWMQLQTYEIANVQVFKQGVGMTSHAINDLYRWFWGIKDGSNLDRETVDNRLRVGYTGLAKNTLSKGDEAMAAQYAKVAYDLSPSEDVADELWAEFVQLVSRWDEVAAVKENAVKRVATVAREGIAEWWNLVSDRYYSNGLITPILEETDRLYSSGEVEAHRQELRGLSATNPYRRGLELMEKIETDLGFWAAMHAGMITEWPLEALRSRVPVSVIQQIQ